MSETKTTGYFITFAVLLGLAFINYLVAKAGMGTTGTAIILSIASVQAFILAAIFMHLRESPRFIWVVVASGFVFVGVLAFYVVADNHGRATMVRPPQAWELPEKVTMPATPKADAAHHAPAAHEAK
jgi:caa(3)-type oxidase subunit IV